MNTRNPVFPLAYSVFGAKAGAWQPELDARWHRAHDSAAAERGAASMPRRAIARTILDPRMGVLLFALAAAGALRRRDRITLALLVMLATQVAVWLFATHLFARFAVVLLIPLLPLASRLVEDVPVSRDAGPVSAVAHKRSRTIFLIACAAIVCAVALNLYHLGSLYYDHTRIAGQPLSAFGRTDLFVEGKWPGMQHLSAINALGPDTRVMLVGEARTFYVLPPRQYATVFNRLPLADAVQRDPSPPAILAWLRQQGTTHILVNWAEMNRLAGTYGFYPGIDRALFDRLTAAGLKELTTFSAADALPPYATLYEVPR